jgi:hypothetical protein
MFMIALELCVLVAQKFALSDQFCAGARTHDDNDEVRQKKVQNFPIPILIPVSQKQNLNMIFLKFIMAEEKSCPPKPLWCHSLSHRYLCANTLAQAEDTLNIFPTI